jgi:hypothetical protein
VGARVILRPRSADEGGGDDEEDEEIRIRWTVAYNRSVGQAVIQFHGPPRAFSAVRMVDVCFHPEAQFSGTVPLGMVVAASRTVP